MILKLDSSKILIIAKVSWMQPVKNKFVSCIVRFYVVEFFSGKGFNVFFHGERYRGVFRTLLSIYDGAFRKHSS